ncbi:MAG: hypothetical protein K6F29_04280 [Bacteroidales bacterium]|nr:hypothetical protein [Bacteroidales bacterium]
MKLLSKKVLAVLAVVAFVGLMATSCNKYDKMPILGTWEMDVKAIQNSSVDSCKEVLTFDSGSNPNFTQNYMERMDGRLTAHWTIQGKIERKNNHINFYNRVQTEGSVTKNLGDLECKYKIENDQLILINKSFEADGYPDGKKIYSKK